MTANFDDRHHPPAARPPMRAMAFRGPVSARPRISRGDNGRRDRPAPGSRRWDPQFWSKRSVQSPVRWKDAGNDPRCEPIDEWTASASLPVGEHCSRPNSLREEKESSAASRPRFDAAPPRSMSAASKVDKPFIDAGG
tara:strand:- start:1286 stop:1699 length:414 start_codon:yes stop_codon:yes gene_type:complete